jgi:phosphoribosylglycinamide formyltransferase 1
MAPVSIAVLASGGGTNLQALLDAQAVGFFNGRIALVFSNQPAAPALDRARACGVETFCIPSSGFMGSREAYDQMLLDRLQSIGIELVCLAGYMRILTSTFTKAYAGRLMNIHPALLPKYGGEGFFGQYVHQAVLDSGDTESGATVHFVDESVDSGPVIIQRKVPVRPGDTVELLSKRVLEIEHQIYPEAVKLFCAKRLEIKSGKVIILPS